MTWRQRIHDAGKPSELAVVFDDAAGVLLRGAICATAGFVLSFRYGMPYEVMAGYARIAGRWAAFGCAFAVYRDRLRDNLCTENAHTVSNEPIVERTNCNEPADKTGFSES